MATMQNLVSKCTVEYEVQSKGDYSPCVNQLCRLSFGDFAEVVFFQAPFATPAQVPVTKLLPWELTGFAEWVKLLALNNPMIAFVSVCWAASG
jgi:hypothetical protein